MKRLKAGLVLFWLLAASLPARAQSPSFPLDHWVYPFLERLETRRVLTGILDDTRPLSRDELAAYLVPLLTNPQKAAQLNSVEKEQLKTLVWELHEYLPPNLAARGEKESPRLMKLRRWRFLGRIFPNHLYTNGRNFISYSDNGFQAFLDPVIYRHGVWEHSDSASAWTANFRDSHGVTAWGLWGKRLSFFFRFEDSKIWGSRR